MPDLSHLKPGDPVAILSGSHDAQTLHVKRATVKRVTKTQFTLNESDYTYRLSDGKRRGHSSMWERTPTAYPTDHPVVREAVYNIKTRNLQHKLWNASQQVANAARGARFATREDLDRTQARIADTQDALDALRAHLDSPIIQTGGPDETEAGS